MAPSGSSTSTGTSRAPDVRLTAWDWGSVATTFELRADPAVGAGSGRVGPDARRGQPERIEQRVAEVARIDHVVVAEVVGRRVRATELGVVEDRLQLVVGTGGLAAAGRGHGA